MTINKCCSLLTLFLAFSFSVFADETLPTAQDISDSAQKAKQTYDSFFEQTLEIRMQFEYSGRFLNPQDKDTLLKAAQQASADLEQIINTQTAMKKTIEAYQKDDWETLFGQTGLWRKLHLDLLNTQTAKLEIDYYLARIAGDSKVDQQFFDTLTKSGFSPCAPIKASLEKIKCLGPSEPNELDHIADALAKSDCSDSPEILLSLAILQNKYAPDNLQSILSHSSKAIELFGKIIFADLSAGSDLNSLNPITAELAAYAASTANPSRDKRLLLAIVDVNKLKTPGTLALAANPFVESDPAKAIELLIESSDLQTRQKELLFRIDASAAAECAAKLASDNFNQEKIDCNLALAAFDNYRKISSDKMTDELHYHCGEILRHCGKPLEAVHIFSKLAAGPNSIWHDKASLELLKIKTDTSTEDTLPQLQTFILNCKGRDVQNSSLRREALDLYCRKSLSYDSNEYASRVLGLFDKAEPTPGFQYDLYKAQSLYRLGMLEESAGYMTKAIAADSGSMNRTAIHIVTPIIDRIERRQKNAEDYNKLLQNCFTLADFANKSANSPQTALLLAEVCILSDKKPIPDFPITDDLTSLRVQARLLMQEGKFDQSAKLWAKITELRRNESEEQNQKSYGWWQAKFYELDCLSKSPQADRQNIAHIIDVLSGSNPQIPAPWPEKLSLLKKQCSTN
jgi:hypothetical protein